MKSIVAALLLLGALAAAHQSDEHPIEGVISMLQTLGEKAEEEGKTEAEAYAKFETWCADSKKTMDGAISEGKENIASLEDTVAGKTKEIETLTSQIKALEEGIQKEDTADAEANKMREEEAEAYKVADKDFEETIKAIDEAIKAIEDAKGKVALVQLTGPVRRALSLVKVIAPPKVRAGIAALLQGAPHPELMEPGAYEKSKAKYKFKGGGVIQLLKQLQSNFEDDKTEATKAETNAQNAYELAKEARKAALDAAKATLKEKNTEKGDAETALAEAQASLKEAKSDLDADTKTLEETDKSCYIKKTEWEKRSEVRAGEIEAMEKAIEILSKVSGVRTEPPENPVLPTSPVSFLQVRGADPKMKAVTFLRAQAKVLHSKVLDKLATAVKAHLSGPFDEVNGMIQKMIFRLMAEQKDEDDHKNWCDIELSKTESSKTDKDDKLVELNAKIEKTKADAVKLSAEATEANEMVAQIDAHVKEATDIRTTGKKENAMALKDAQDAQKALAKAIAVLTAHYKKSGELETKPWEFLQEAEPVKLPENPSTWDASYTGVADADGKDGILSMLEEVASRFSTMEADTKAQEMTDRKDFEDDMQACGIEKARRVKEAEMKTHEQARLNEKVDSLTKTKKHVSDELHAVEVYLKDLQPACVDGGSTYEDRKAARAKEIESLRNAQNILAQAFSEKAAAFLQARK